MKKVEQVFSHVRDVVKKLSLNITIFDYDEEGKEYVYYTDIEKDVEEALERLELPKGMKRIIEAINGQFEYALGEELAKAIHEDLMDMWKRIDALEERIKKS